MSSRSVRGDNGPGQRTDAGGRCRPASARRRARCRQDQPLPPQDCRRIRPGTSVASGSTVTCGTSRSSRGCSTFASGSTVSCATTCTSRDCISRVFGGSRTCGTPRARLRSVASSAPDGPGAAVKRRRRPHGHPDRSGPVSARRGRGRHTGRGDRGHHGAAGAPAPAAAARARTAPERALPAVSRRDRQARGRVVGRGHGGGPGHGARTDAAPGQLGRLARGAAALSVADRRGGTPGR